MGALSRRLGGGLTPVEHWSVSHLAGTPGEIHGRPAPQPRRSVVVAAPIGAAVVLGRAQPESHFDHRLLAAAGVALVRRASGGSAVFVDGAEPLWVDVAIARHDAEWDDDVGRAPLWLGRVWASALSLLGATDVAVHSGAMFKGPWSDRLCFAGIGPGEVLVGGRKVVGIAQRRTREAALFSCAVRIAPGGERLAEFLDESPPLRREAAHALAEVSSCLAATSVGRVTAGQVAEAFLSCLRRAG